MQPTRNSIRQKRKWNTHTASSESDRNHSGTHSLVPSPSVPFHLQEGYLPVVPSALADPVLCGVCVWCVRVWSKRRDGTAQSSWGVLVSAKKLRVPESEPEAGWGRGADYYLPHHFRVWNLTRRARHGDPSITRVAASTGVGGETWHRWRTLGNIKTPKLER